MLGPQKLLRISTVYQPLSLLLYNTISFVWVVMLYPLGSVHWYVVGSRKLSAVRCTVSPAQWGFPALAPCSHSKFPSVSTDAEIFTEKLVIHESVTDTENSCPAVMGTFSNKPEELEAITLPDAPPWSYNV